MDQRTETHRKQHQLHRLVSRSPDSQKENPTVLNIGRPGYLLLWLKAEDVQEAVRCCLPDRRMSLRRE